MGILPATNQLRLAIALPLRNQASLSNLLQDIYNPTSTNYHHYLKPEEFAERFGPSKEDYEALKAFAVKNGLKVSTTHPNRVLLDVTGSAADVQRAFHVKLRTYHHPTENRTFFAPDTEPSLDLSVPVLHISGLSDYGLPRPRISSIKPTVAGNDSGGTGPGLTYMGNDFRAAYVPDTTLTGVGQIVGLLQFDGYTPADIAYYESKAGLPNVPLQNVLIDGATGAPSGTGGEVEVSLDIEDSIAMAPGLAEVILYIAPNPSPFVDILNRMATDNVAKQLSCSWYTPNGSAEPAADLIFQQMAAQGQSFFSASGDQDAYSGLIPFPGDTPYITQVGGTILATSGTGGPWLNEIVWNVANGIGSGGGISTQYPIPSYQTNTSMTANQGSTTMRNTPDVALTAENVYVRVNGFDRSVAGTSCAAPLWAGFTALVNQEAMATGKPSVGFINPVVYAIGAGISGVSYTNSFHDITYGGNTRPGSSNQFLAVAGYDLCTGWGTPAGQHLIDALANPEDLLITPTNGFASAGGVGGPFTITSGSLTLANAGTNVLTWTLANVPGWLDVSTNGGTLLPGGPATTLIVSLNSMASNLSLGSYSATILFTNLSDNFAQSRRFTLSIETPPNITSQPVNQAVLERAPAQFSVSATGGLPLSYNWQFDGTNLLDDGTNISGSATSTLNIQVVSAANVGNYAVVISNPAGTIMSTNAALTFTPSRPVILQPPTNETVYVGMNASFSAFVGGTTPYAYQWSFEGSNIAGATDSLLMLTNVQLTDAGDYTVTVTNSLGETSAEANLAVNPCDPPPAGVVGWWPGEDYPDDIVGTNNAVLSGGAGYAPGRVGHAFNFPAVGAQVTASTGGLPIGSSDRTMECWVYFDSFISAYPANIAVYGNGIPGNYGQAFQLYVSPNNQRIGFTDVGVGVIGPQVFAGQWYHVAVTSQGGTNVNLYLDGTNVASSVFSPPFNTPPGTSLLIGSMPFPGHQPYQMFGRIDELSIYTRALTSNEIAAIYNAGGGGKCFSPSPPFITEQPTNMTVPVGSSVAFNVVAVGLPPFFYQWTFDGTNIANATSTSLQLTNVQVNQSGNYAVIVSNALGSVTSSNATLTVYGIPPSITQDPNNMNVPVDSAVAFSVAAAGSPPLFYQWTFDGTNIPNATNNALILTGLQTNESGNYAVVVSNAFGSVISSNATLMVYGIPPSISQQPSNTIVNVTGLTSFQVGATGTTPLFYQWAFDGTNIAGATNSTLLLTNVQLSQAGTYQVAVVNAFGSTNSSNAILTVNPEPCFPAPSGIVGWWQGENNSSDSAGTNNGVLAGGATYTNGIVGQAFDFTSTGAQVTATTGHLPVGSGARTMECWVYINSLQGSQMNIASYGTSGINNEFYQLGVFSDNRLFFSQSGGAIFGPALTTNQWYHVAVTSTNNTAILYLDGTNVASGSITISTPSGTKLYIGGVNGSEQLIGCVDELSIYNHALASNEIAAIYTTGSSGKCPLAPFIVTQPSGTTVPTNASATFKVVASGSVPLAYQWTFNGVGISGAAASTLSLTNVQQLQAGAYAVVVSNVAGSITSTAAVLTVTGPPYITNQPLSQTDFVGTTAVFNVGAIGSPTSYQWEFDGTNISGATNSILTLTNLLLTQSGNYSVRVSNSYGGVMSSNALLTVLPKLGISALSNGIGGDYTLYLHSQPNSTNRLWMTTNVSLDQWQVIATNITDTNGLAQFIDTNTAGMPQKFYRLSYP